jgi:hypothetical protein
LVRALPRNSEPYKSIILRDEADLVSTRDTE